MSATARSMWPCAAHSGSNAGDLAGISMYRVRVGRMSSSQRRSKKSNTPGEDVRDLSLIRVLHSPLMRLVSVLADGHDREGDLHPLAQIRATRVHRGVPGHPEVAPVDRRLRPERRGDLAAEVARHLPVRRVNGLEAGALEGGGRMFLAAEPDGIHETAHEPIVGHGDAGHRDRRID